MTYAIYPNSMKNLPLPEQGRKVVIITRTKNRPVLLARAFASILGQTHQDWHLYLVNDGGDPLPVDQLVETHRFAFQNRITVKHHETSLGMEAASNAALIGAKGDFVIIHDDDDAWKPQFLEKTVAYLNAPEHSQTIAVVTNCILVHEKITDSSSIEIKRDLWPEARDLYNIKDMLIINRFPPICMLIRKVAVDYLEGFNSNMPVLGDWDFNLRLLLLGNIGGLQQELAYYYHRVNEHTLYNNSNHHGKHEHYNQLYIDSLLRDYLSKEPGFIGVMNVLLTHINNIDLNIQNKLNELNKLLNHIHEINVNTQHITMASQNVILPLAHTQNQILRIPRWMWRKLLPLRRKIAWLRGRT